MLACVGWAAAPARAQAPPANLDWAQLYGPFTGGSTPTPERVSVVTPRLADNGLSVPFRVWVDSPMTAQDHVTDLWLLSQRNPVTVMAKMHMGPHMGRAEFSTRVRLAGGQQLVALAPVSYAHLTLPTNREV